MKNLKVRNVALKTSESTYKIMNEKKVVAPASVGSSKENCSGAQPNRRDFFSLVNTWLGCLSWGYWWFFYSYYSLSISL